jgi:nicotinamidase-related amidase
MNLAEAIKSLKMRGGGHRIAKIHATLDSHHRNDIGHTTFWKGVDGKCPPPFTIINPEDVESQQWVPRVQAVRLKDNTGKELTSLQYGLYYTRALKTKGRNPLLTWPVHCQIGKWGQLIYQPLSDAYDDWCEATNRWIDFVTKGQWPFTEHYSAIVADVPWPDRRETQMNVDLLNDCNQASRVIWTGWAGSHCTRWTGLDGVNYFGEDPVGSGSNEFLRKSTFISDCCAAVGDLPGTTTFKDWRESFLNEVSRRGAQVMTLREFVDSL